MIPELEKPKITEIKVRMDCNGCVQKIKKALYGINGIYDLYIDFPQQKLTIIGWADPEKIMKAIKKTRKIATICSDSEQAADPHAVAQPADHHLPQHHGGETANIPSHEVVVVGGPPGHSHTEVTPGQVVVHETHSAPHSDSIATAQLPAQPHETHETGQVHVTHHQPPEHGQVTHHQPPEHGHVTHHHAPEHGHVTHHHAPEHGHVVHQHTSEPGIVHHNVPEHGQVIHHNAPEHGHVVHHQAPEHGHVVHHQAPEHGHVVHHRPSENGHVVHHQPTEYGHVVHHQAPEHGHGIHHRPSENGHVVHHQAPEHGHVIHHQAPEHGHVIHHRPSENGHGHSTSNNYHYNIRGAVSEAPTSAAPVTVTHSYNTHKPSPYVTEYIRPLTSHKPSPYAYEHKPQQPTHYSPKIIDRYSEEYYNTGTSSNNGNITSIFSDENPNACTLM